MSDAERHDFFLALESNQALKDEFIKQKNLWAVSTSLSIGGQDDNSETDLFLYQLKNRKEEDKKYRGLVFKLNSYKVAAAVMLALLLGSVAIMLQQNPRPHQKLAYTEMFVPKGEKSEITLPDGTHVFINAGSKLLVPTSFSATNRHIQLHGQAYFSVEHDPENPFIVATESINIEVLGTRFDLACYPDEEFVTTTLDEGSVRFNGANNNTVNGRVLKPGETARYHKSSGVFKIQKAEPSVNASSWKEGVFRFKDMPFNTLAKRIERMYNVEIEIDPKLKFERYTGEISDETIWDVMNNFAIATPFNVESSGRKIKVTAKQNFK